MRLRAGPPSLWLLRHGQSEGNVARDAAEATGASRVEIATRDADTPLSRLGERQAAAFGRWLAEQPPGERPTAVLTSPYVRARRTAELLLDVAGGDLARLPLEVDERLRDREMGTWDQLTWAGITAADHDESERAVHLGRYYHRPPGGESWADIVLRLRTLLADVARELPDERVLLVTHDVPIQLVRALVEGMDEATTVELVLGTAYANCALTRLERRSGGYELTAYDQTVPLEEPGAESTEDPDAVVAPR